jgi:hypothetical protein
VTAYRDRGGAVGFRHALTALSTVGMRSNFLRRRPNSFFVDTIIFHHVLSRFSYGMRLLSITLI